MKCRHLFSNRFEKPKERGKKIKNMTANTPIIPITLNPHKQDETILNQCLLNKRNYGMV